MVRDLMWWTVGLCLALVTACGTSHSTQDLVIEDASLDSRPPITSADSHACTYSTAGVTICTEFAAVEAANVYCQTLATLGAAELEVCPRSAALVGTCVLAAGSGTQFYYGPITPAQVQQACTLAAGSFAPA